LFCKDGDDSKGDDGGGGNVGGKEA